MLGRLIDADKLKDSLKDMQASCIKTEIKSIMQEMIDVFFPGIIDEQPTAYDVDNVLCQLNDILCDEIDQPVADCVAEAVRGGGVDTNEV